MAGRPLRRARENGARRNPPGPVVRDAVQRARLGDKNLIRADLIRADLIGADLIEANLTRANLTEANLDWANFQRANLREANLHGAYLSGANLSWADIAGANLTGAYFDNTTMPDGSTFTGTGDEWMAKQERNNPLRRARENARALLNPPDPVVRYAALKRMAAPGSGAYPNERQVAEREAAKLEAQYGLPFLLGGGPRKRQASPPPAAPAAGSASRSYIDKDGWRVEYVLGRGRFYYKDDFIIKYIPNDRASSYTYALFQGSTGPLRWYKNAKSAKEAVAGRARSSPSSVTFSTLRA